MSNVKEYGVDVRCFRYPSVDFGVMFNLTRIDCQFIWYKFKIYTPLAPNVNANIKDVRQTWDYIQLLIVLKI